MRPNPQFATTLLTGDVVVTHGFALSLQHITSTTGSCHYSLSNTELDPDTLPWFRLLGLDWSTRIMRRGARRPPDFRADSTGYVQSVTESIYKAQNVGLQYVGE